MLGDRNWKKKSPKEIGGPRPLKDLDLRVIRLEQKRCVTRSQ